MPQAASYYEIHDQLPLRHPQHRDHTVGELIRFLEPPATGTRHRTHQRNREQPAHRCSTPPALQKRPDLPLCAPSCRCSQVWNAVYGRCGQTGGLFR